jgi:hypothetical protein
MPPTSQDLTTKISAYIEAWRTMARAYALLSIILRGTLIVASAIVAAKLGLKCIFREITFSVLSVVVAAGTALEAWLKPREKWKGFMTDYENAEDLLIRLENTDATDSKRIDEFRQEFQVILATHREKNVF